MGGAERSVQFLAEALVKAGHEVVVVSAAPESGLRTDYVNEIKVYYVGLKNLYWPFFGENSSGLLKPLWHGIDTYNPSMARAVGRIIDKGLPDLIHTNNLSGFSVSTWSAIKRRGIALVHTLRDYYLLCPRSSMFRGGRNCTQQCYSCRLYSWLRRRFSSLPDAVVGVSRFILDRHLSLGFFDDVGSRNVVFNMYEPGESLVFPTKKTSMPLRIGYLGRLHVTKGIELLIKAVKSLPKETCTLKIAGRGEAGYERHLKDVCGNSNICFLGFVDPQNFFRGIDVLVVPSLWHEPLARTIFEAYAHGVPVVGSMVGGTPEIVEEGTTGFVFDPDISDSLESAIKRFVADLGLARRMRLAVLKRGNDFLPERIVKQYLRVYEEALGRKT